MIVWVGVESEAEQREPEDDSEYICPACGEILAHFPLDEIGDSLWLRRSQPQGTYGPATP